MKIIILIAPSEGKNIGGNSKKEELSFKLKKPFEIIKNITEKDLKCKGERFLEGKNLNENIENGPFLEAIKRYSGVVFNAINYEEMNEKSKKFLEENLIILSGMYGILKPLDKIGNYKLPVETKGIYKFWGEKISEKIAEIKPDFIINLMPASYSKLVGIGKCSKLKIIRGNFLKKNTKIININFFENKKIEENGKTKTILKKISHGVKKFRGEFIKKICEEQIIDYKIFGGEIVENSDDLNFIDVNFIK